MTNKTEHIIHKLSVEINADDYKNANKLRDQSMSLVKEALIPTIEKVLDKLDTGSTIRIDQLKINLDSLNINNLESQITQQIKKHLPSEINKALENKKAIEVKYSSMDTFDYFLKNGILPWWNKQISHQAFEQSILKELKSNVSTVQSYFKNINEVRLERLVFQFSDTFFHRILEIQNIPKTFLNALEEFQKDLLTDFSPRLVRNQIWKSVIPTVFNQSFNLESSIKAVLLKTINQLGTSTNKTQKEILNHLIKISKNENRYHSLTETNLLVFKNQNINPKDQITNLIQDESTSEYYTNNAGLIILHPFITYLFQHLEYTKDNKFIDQHHQHQAALILQYLCNGLTTNPEYDLILNKVLCGIPPETPLENTLIISEEIKSQCQQLLESTIHHWSALKNTSIEGLQNTFLIRQGKLSQKDNNDWKLFVENKTLDILISKLPWSISMIKLPWMKNILWVDWA